ncbi:MAG: DNA starvation/stationary phase protection protein [Chloroflexi bacterium]|nr:DNA starvation/stationary phase protection protein [Chloroflexota bacterium]
MVSVETTIGADQRDLVAAELQPLLADLINLSLQGKQAHWNVTGPFFQPVHAQLDTIVDDARGWADDVAERMVTVGAPAAGQAADVERDSSLERFMEGTVTDKQAIAMMADRVTTVVARARGSMDKLGEVDLASQDLVIEIVRGLEKHLWMLRVQLT